MWFCVWMNVGVCEYVGVFVCLSGEGGEGLENVCVCVFLLSCLSR